MAEPASPPGTTVIARDAVLEGTLKTSGPVRVDGAIAGDVRSSAAVHVGATGRVLGELRAQTLLLAGRVDGIVMVRDVLTVGSAGRVQGYVRYRALSVERGGILNCSSSQRDRCSEEELDDAAQ